MKKGYDRLVWILTFLCGGIGCGFCLMILRRTAEDTMGKILWSGLFFSVPLLASLLGCYLAEVIQRRRFTVLRKRGRVLTLIFAAAAGFLVGAGGQAVYMISPYEKNADVDLALLLDGSGSMEDKKAGCEEAARALLEQMDESSRVQVVSFAAAVLGNTELLPMDEDGKRTVTDFIRSVDVIGGTEFGQPLSFALGSLAGSREEGRTQAVLLLSDGEGTFPAALENEYLAQDLILYTIRIDTGTEETEDTRRLISMAQATGGFDILVPADENGQVDTGALTEAFSQVFSASRGIGMGEDMIVYGGAGSLPALHVLIRTGVFILYALLVGLIYYRSLRRRQLQGNLAAGALLSVLITILGQLGLDSPVLSSVLFCVLIFCAYTTYDDDREADGYV